MYRQTGNAAFTIFSNSFLAKKKKRTQGLTFGDRMVAIGDCEFGFGDCEKKSVANLATVKFASFFFVILFLLVFLWMVTKSL